MTELLLKDLSARLPYGVFCDMGLDYPLPLQSLFVDKLDGILLDFYEDGKDYQVYLGEVKPYLFPLSSMTEEQKKECFKGTPLEIDKYGTIAVKDDFFGNSQYTDLEIYLEVIDWLNKNHFDYRGLISAGLAIDATDKNIY
jgi:hypothetical protein